MSAEKNLVLFTDNRYGSSLFFVDIHSGGAGIQFKQRVTEASVKTLNYFRKFRVSGIQNNQKITEATAKIPAASVIISYFLFKFPHRLIQRHSLSHRIPAQTVDLLDLLHLLARQDITAHRKNR